MTSKQTENKDCNNYISAENVNDKSKIEDNKITIITVIRDKVQYNDLFVNNININNNTLIYYDNSIDNIPITIRYNDFIENKMNEDTWLVFCHQDFEFCQEINSLLNKLDKSFIYGPIGATPRKFLNIYFRFDWKRLRKLKIGISKRSVTIGEIGENQNGKIVKVGKYLKNPKFVDTVDCCCLIVHSSLISKHQLRFDEKLDWHLYSEDFSLNAKINHNVLTKAVQIESIHYSCGSFNIGFQYSLVYLKNKYNNIGFASTTFDAYNFNFVNRL